jgi:hypothetical protein
LIVWYPVFLMVTSPTKSSEKIIPENVRKVKLKKLRPEERK